MSISDLPPLDPALHVRRPNRSGRMELWEATTRDGLWTYHRLADVPGTPRDACHIPTNTVRYDFPSLRAAREWSAEQCRAPRTVQDCPACVWAQFGALGLGAFADDHRGELAGAGRELIRRPLIEAWRRRGYRARLVDHRDHTDIPSGHVPSPGVYDAVHQAAADQVTTDQVVHEAGLVYQLAAYRHAHAEAVT